jgi:toxin ParE1/3/4
LTFALQVRRAAELEIAEAQLWYEAKDKGLGAEFLSEVSRTIDRILETPLIYQDVHRGIRRAIVHRFPYLIWYQVGSETVVVMACTYAGRDPQRIKTHLR